MKSNYWKPSGSSSIILLFIAVASLGSVAAVENIQTDLSQPFAREKLEAADKAQKAFRQIKAARLERGLAIDPATDISQSGLIGESMSAVTSNNGSLPAKQMTVNPNFAAVVVDMLQQAGVQPGDTVAVGCSGSFPAMNICVLSAAEALDLRPIVISSATGSQWGANSPELLWIDMEGELVQHGVLHHRSIAASLGGIEDQAIGMPAEGQQILRDAIARNDLHLIKCEDYLDSVNQRMNLYRRHADGAPIKAYINVGGGTVSVGTKKGKKLFEPGVNLREPLSPLPVDSVMGRFAAEDVPVIHLVHIDDLAMRYGLPLQPATIPRVGEGEVYTPQDYNKWLAAGFLSAIVISLGVVAHKHRAIATSGVSPRSASESSRSSRANQPDPMPL